MTFTFALDSSNADTLLLSRVRLLIPDDTAEYELFDDAKINGFLFLEGGSIKRAAACACEVIGSTQALIQKVQKTRDTETDGAKLMDAFLKRAATLRKQADTEAEGLTAGNGFEAVEYLPDGWYQSEGIN